MKIELTDDERQEVITALSHWRAYLISQGRDETTVKDVLDRLRGPKPRVKRVQ